MKYNELNKEMKEELESIHSADKLQKYVIENDIDLSSVSGGARRTYGYCPYTEDRGCRVKEVGNFDNNNERCRYCEWRAW